MEIGGKCRYTLALSWWWLCRCLWHISLAGPSKMRRIKVNCLEIITSSATSYRPPRNTQIHNHKQDSPAQTGKTIRQWVAGFLRLNCHRFLPAAYQPAFCDNGIQMYTLVVGGLLCFSRLSHCGKGAGNCHIKCHLQKKKTRGKKQRQTMAVKINSNADGSLFMNCALLITEYWHNSLHLSWFQKDFNPQLVVLLSAAHKS